MTTEAQSKWITKYKYMFMFTKNERHSSKGIYTTQKLNATKVDSQLL